MEPDPRIPTRSAGWQGADLPDGQPARALRDPTAWGSQAGRYPEVSGRVGYLELPEGAVGLAALVKVKTGGGRFRWELQITGCEDYELLGALRVQAATLEDRLRGEL